MHKVRSFTLIVLVSIYILCAVFLYPYKVYAETANGNGDNGQFTITITGDSTPSSPYISTNDKQLTFQITPSKYAFDDSGNQSYYLRVKTKDQVCRAIIDNTIDTASAYEYTASATTKNPKSLSFTANFSNSSLLCDLKSGEWSLDLSLDSTFQTNLFSDATFYVNSSNGGQPTSISYFQNNKILCKNANLQFYLNNADPNQSYSFWWDGDTNPFFTINKPDIPQLISIKSDVALIDKLSFTGSESDKKYLCWAQGTSVPNGWTTGNTDKCAGNTSLEFDVPANYPAACGKANTTIKCSFDKNATEVGNGSTVYKATANGINFPDGQTFNGDLINTDTNPPKVVNSYSGLKKDSTGIVSVQTDNLPVGNYTFVFKDSSNNKICQASLNVTKAPPITSECSKNGNTGSQSNCTSSGGETCDPGNNGAPDPIGAPNPSHHGIYTAIGCIPTDPQALIAAILKFALSAGGGISLLLMIFGALRIMLSAGNPEAVKKGREQFIAAFMGLLFIIFAVTIIQILGVDILQIPGFH